MFRRDVELEQAAVNLLHWDPERVKRTSLSELERAVKSYVEQEQDTPIDIRLNISEDEIPQVEAVVAPSMKQLAVIPEDDEDVKALDTLITPINVSSYVNATEGLLKLHKHIDKVFKLTAELETGVREKRQIMALHEGVLDDEDRGHIQTSIRVDHKQMTVLYKWLTGIMDDLSQLIRVRLDVQGKLQRIKHSTPDLSDKIHRRTLKLKAIYDTISSRVECMQIEE
jgi:hypothetical protein